MVIKLWKIKVDLACVCRVSSSNFKFFELARPWLGTRLIYCKKTIYHHATEVLYKGFQYLILPVALLTPLGEGWAAQPQAYACGCLAFDNLLLVTVTRQSTTMYQLWRATGHHRTEGINRVCDYYAILS